MSDTLQRVMRVIKEERGPHPNSSSPLNRSYGGTRWTKNETWPARSAAAGRAHIYKPTSSTGTVQELYSTMRAVFIAFGFHHLSPNLPSTTPQPTSLRKLSKASKAASLRSLFLWRQRATMALYTTSKLSASNSPYWPWCWREGNEEKVV